MAATRVWIQLQKDIYTCGEPIQGTINVICQNVLPNQQLKFKIKGYEETKWVELIHIPVSPERPLTIPENEIYRAEDVDCSDDSSDSDDDEIAGFYKNRKEYIRKNNNEVYQVRRGEGKYRIMNQVQDLGQLALGHYSFPFQFNSLKEWPGTFFQEEDKEKGKIKYNLTAYYGPFKSKSEIYLQEFKAAEQDKHSVTSNITSCCCMGKGKVQLDVLFLKDALYIGEQQTVKIKIDCSQLSCNIDSVSCSLVNQLTFRSDTGTSKSRSVTVFSKAYQGCQSGQLKEFDESFIVSFPNAKQANRPTCHGNKITSQYIIYISANNDASCTCCSDNATVGNDTHIFSKPSLPSAAKLSIDPNFNPKVQPVLNIAITAPTQKKMRPPPPPTNIQQGVQVYPQTNANPGIGMQQPIMMNNNYPQQPPSQQQGLLQQNNQAAAGQQQGVQMQQFQNQNQGVGQQQGVQIQPFQQSNQGIGQQQGVPIQQFQQNNQGINQQQPIQQQQIQGLPIQQQNQGIGQQQQIYQQIQPQPIQQQGIGQQQPIQQQIQPQPIQQQGIGQQQPVYQQIQPQPVQQQGIGQQQPILQQQLQPQPLQQQGIGQQQPVYQQIQPQPVQQLGIGQQQPILQQQQQPQPLQQQGIGQQQPIQQSQPVYQQNAQQAIQIQGGVQIQTGFGQQQNQQGQQGGPGNRNFGAAGSNNQGGYN